MLLHVVAETDAGIVVRGAKFETAAAYANQAFVKPTIGDWGDAELSDYAVGFLADMAAPGVRHICRIELRRTAPAADYPLAGRFDEVDTMIVFDDVEIPWENVFFYRHTRAAAYIRATLHRYSMFPFVQRHLRFADLLDRGRVHERRADGRANASGRPREARRARVLPREHQRAPHGRDRACGGEPRRSADAEPGAALHGPRRGVHAASGDDAPGTRPLRRPALRHTGRGLVRESRDRPLAREVLPRRAAGKPRIAAGSSPSPATCSTRTMPATGSRSSCSRSRRRSRTCSPSTTTTTSRGRSISYAASPGCPSRPP